MYTKILLCGLRCTGKTTAFWGLQRALGWPVFSASEYIRDIIRIYHLTPKEIENRSNEVSADIDDRIHRLLLSPYHAIIDARVYGKIDQKYESVLKVLLTTHDTIRVQRAALREKSTVEKYGQKFLSKEQEWLRRISSLYGRNLFDPSLYDTVIDTTPMNDQHVLQALLAKLNLTTN